jgi:hybrid cluster-associated redox disulfide protein
MMEITGNTLINELLDEEEDAVDVLLHHGLNCLGCPGSRAETLEDAAVAHGVDLQELIEDLNEFLNRL